MALGDTYFIIGDWFQIHFVENIGMAFGWKFGGELGKLILTIFRIVAITGIGYYLYTIIKQQKSRILIVSISLIFAGALGNIIDSVFYGLIFDASGPLHVATAFPEGGGYAGLFHGKVVDMLYFPLFDGYYPEWFPFVGGDYFAFFRPVFNIADSSIFIGVSLLIIFQKRLFGTKNDTTENQEEFTDKEPEDISNAEEELKPEGAEHF